VHAPTAMTEMTQLHKLTPHASSTISTQTNRCIKNNRFTFIPPENFFRSLIRFLLYAQLRNVI
jgi:hypothetical protein